MQVDEVLEAAAEYIAENGWHQGDFYGADGKSACAWGSLEAASGGEYNSSFVWLSSQVGNIPVWNDAPDRTKEEVIETMREAAQQWRKENGDSARSTAGAEGLV